MLWRSWRWKGICLGSLWGILAWIPFYTPYWQSGKWLVCLPAWFGLAGETFLYRVADKFPLFLNAYFLSVPAGALLGYGLSLPGQLYLWRREAKKTSRRRVPQSDS